MADRRWRTPGRDLQRDLLYGGPVIGVGRCPDGRWELRAQFGSDDSTTSGALYFYVDFWYPSGAKHGGGGCGGLGLANDQRPVVISMSRRGPKTSFCYVGQVVQRGTRVELDLTDGTTIDGLLLKGDLPVHLWIAFTDGTAVPTEIRGFENDAVLDAVQISEESPKPRANACWGPFAEW